MTDSIRDRIAQVIEDYEEYPHPRGYLKHADALLAAFPGLADEPTARADAWEDGYRVGWHDRDDDAKAGWIPSRYEQDTPNPYQKETP